MAALNATFDPATASVLLTIDGTTWSTVPVMVTAVRQVPGEADMRVRGVIGKTVVGGYMVATDHEMPLASLVTYTVTGYDSAGVSVGTAAATVDTTTTVCGVWVKAPGRPDLTVLCQPAELGEVSSPTVGGTYQILSGGAVSIARWSSVASIATSIVLRTDRGPKTARLKALLAVARVVLLQPVGWSDLDAGWYFTSGAAWSNPGHFEEFAFRRCTLPLQSVAVPAGQQASAAWTWAALVETYGTWTAVKAAYAAWFNAAQGAA